MEPRSPGCESSCGISGSTRDHEIVHQLTELLRANGERILSGQSKLSLTTRSLCVLNSQFTQLLGEDEFVTSFDVVPPKSPKMPYAQDIQFLYDFMQKTLALKILHVSSTLQGRVNLGPFRALKILEIKKTPLHLLEGIQRMRGRLTLVICARSLSSLQELFETCGGDLSSPMSWPELRSACLAFNSIEKLDSSLRLVPNLEVLDLSHNSISETDRCLEYLTELSILNLGYNRLAQVPTLAISVREKLYTLVLRNNDIESLNGLEELTGLRDLDVADNCLIDHHKALTCLRSLHRLSALILKGNPLSFHEDHRLLTITTLNMKAAEKMTLDGKPILEAEIKASQRYPSPPKPPSRSTGSNHREGLRPHFSETSLDMSPGSGTHSEADTPHKGKSSRKSGRPGRKVRRALISDLDSGCDAESDLPEHSPETSKASTPQCTEHLDVKKHMESMRAQLGPDWLQTLVDNKTSSNSSSRTSPASQTHRQSPSQNISTQHSKVNGDNANKTPASVERVAKFAIGSIDDEEDGFPEEMAKNSPQARVKYNYPGNDSVKELAKDGDTLSDHVDMTNDRGCEKGPEKAMPPTSALLKSSDSHTIYDRQNTHTDEVDYGLESEPFIVSQLGDTDSQKLVNITPRYLLEKDINGDVLVALDLKCLLTAEVMAVGAMADDGVLDADQSQENGPVIKLTFDYVKKDRRERKYVMENDTHADGFFALLKPILDVNRAQANARDQMQCLKCNKEFTKQSAARTVKSHGSVHVSLDTYSSSIDIGDLTEGLLCPFCASEMLIKVEVSHRSHGSAVNTPIGSFKEPMATSSANPSPWKQDAQTKSELPHRSASSSAFRSIPGSSGYLPIQDEPSSLQSPLVTSQFHTPKESLFHTPPSSEAELSSMYYTQASANDSQTDTTFKSVISGDIGNNNSSPPHLKTAYMSQSAIEMPTQDSEQGVSQNGSLTTPVENKAFQRNSSTQELGRFRKRQDSGSSDILVLSRHPYIQTYPSQDSDIAVLSNPSETSIAVIDSTVSSRDTLDDIEDVWEGPPSDLVYQASNFITVKKDTGDIQEQLLVDTDLSPSGSLTNKTLSSMVSTVYEKSISDVNNMANDGRALEENSCDDTIDGVTVVSLGNESSSFKSTASTPRVKEGYNPFYDDNQNGDYLPNDAPESTGDSNNTPVSASFLDNHFPVSNHVQEAEDPGKIRFFSRNFHQVDHRLKLHLMMSVFTQEDEELALILRSVVYQYSKSEEFAGLMIVSSHRIYFYKIKGPEKADNFEKWLKCVQSYPFSELRYVEIGLGFQTLSLDFGTDSCFKLIIMDQSRCQEFIYAFTGLVKDIIMKTQSELTGITKSNPVTMENLTKQVLEATPEEESDGDSELAVVSFVMAQQHTGEVDASGDKVLTPVSMVITPSHVHLVVEDHQWPRPRDSGELNLKGQQFTPKDRQRITDITSIDLDHASPLDVQINFYDEESSEECVWKVAVESRFSLGAIVHTIRELWEAKYDVELQVNIIGGAT